MSDEAATNFLSVYNLTILAASARYPWFPMPTFELREWFIGLIVANLVFLALTPYAFRNSAWLRPVAYFSAAIHFVNGIGHTLGAIFGSPFPEVHFPSSDAQLLFFAASARRVHISFRYAAVHTTLSIAMIKICLTIKSLLRYMLLTIPSY